MVRLKAALLKLNGLFTTVFQFLYGAIKGSNTVRKEQISVLFQFLYGAIKGVLWAPKILVPKLFQFLYGAIKGVLDTLSSYMWQHFNSCMVRLKAV
ncbi:hypothetical protein SAMN05421747_1351 [Parapedobacter composti]|uniref:Uncharacterized protein n=1 Tax=Parapedobacter composti TaxID=623281 RepID=A0A1I1MFQ0_9SPHI|nr:hypothetical protein SAMN05421747_1351 [Parapedobacter composti]